MEVQRRTESPKGPLFKKLQPPGSKDGTTHLKATGLAVKYRLSMNTQTPKKEPQNKVVRLKKQMELDKQVKMEMEKLKKEEEERKMKAAQDARKTTIELEDMDDFDFDDDDSFFGYENDEDISQKLYMEACKDLRITPIKLVYKTLVSDKLAIIGVVLSRSDSKACAIALVRNSDVETLVLDGNDLGGPGARCFSDAISRNQYISDIKIVDNNLRTEGAMAICNALRKNNFVRRLDLSGNGFCEDDAKYFKDMLDENHGLRELYLSHNKFQELGGEIFAEGLATNDFLRVLDLSWNHLRMRGAMAIGTALQINRHLEKLNISWNGFHIRGAATLAKALEINTVLLDLDLSCNRLSDFCIKILIKGLEKNSTLKVLRLSKNQMYPPGALSILETINNTPTIALELLDLGDQCVTDKFETLYEELKTKRDPFKVIYGMVWLSDRDSLGKNDKDDEEDDLLNEDPLLVLFEYARLQNFRLLDMFQQLDRDNSGSLSRDEFQQGLASVNIPMRKQAIKKLIDRMDRDGDGEIDFGELLSAQKAHKEKLKAFMKGDRPLEETELGRIDKLLRQIMYKRFLMRKF